jgi:hypothetical protein
MLSVRFAFTANTPVAIAADRSVLWTAAARSGVAGECKEAIAFSAFG